MLLELGDLFLTVRLPPGQMLREVHDQKLKHVKGLSRSYS
jgi:hypothetical protein